MNELIPIQKESIGGQAMQTVNARDLHQFLEVNTPFSMWIQRRIQEYNFQENHGFVTTHKIVNGAKQVDYHITIDMAKELAMVERNEKGKQARQYFIECEKQLRQIKQPQTALEWAEAFITSEKERLRLAHENKELQPKAEFFDDVAEAEGMHSVSEVAQMLGTGEKRLFKFLREQKILKGDNLPYQRYLDAGYVAVVEKPFQDFYGRERLSSKAMFTGKGLTWLHKLYSLDTVPLLRAFQG